MATGKTITIFLVDGNPDGLLTCELSNWTGKAVKIPRLLLKDAAKRLVLNKTGVYFLFGRDEENPDATAVYIGEAEMDQGCAPAQQRSRSRPRSLRHRVRPHGRRSKLAQLAP